MNKLWFVFSGVFFSAFTFAQSSPYIPIKSAYYNLPIKPERTISFKTTEGSHMNVDISPDGKTIVFDLLGDLYTIPADGGEATQLTRGMAVNVCPVWSPDGTMIAYLSDASGSLHLTVRDILGNIVGTYGVDEKQLEVEVNWPYVSIPVWSPSGEFIAAGSNVYHLSGNKVALTAEIPGYIMIILPNGNFYYHTTNGGGDSDDTIYLHDAAKNITTMVGKYNRSQKISADGKYISSRFMDRTKNLSKLRVYNTITKETKELTDYPKEDNYSRQYAFTRDNKYLYVSYGGNIRKVNLETGKDEIIPFTANVNVEMGPITYNRFQLSKDSIAIKNIRYSRVSPNGKQIIFCALNRIYIKDLPNGTPRVLVNQPFKQIQPAWSPDGQWITYVSRNESYTGHIWRVRSRGAKPEQLTRELNSYDHPSWSADGKVIMVGGYGLDTIIQINSTLRLHSVAPLQYPSFSADGSMIFSQINKYSDTGMVLTSCHPNHKDQHEVAMVPQKQEKGHGGSAVQEYVVSPDQRFIVYRNTESLFLLPMLNLGVTQLLYSGQGLSSSPLIRFAIGAWDPCWEEGGKYISWTSGGKYYRIATEKINTAAQEKTKDRHLSGEEINTYFIDTSVIPEDSISLELTAPRYYGKGTVTLTNARIATMNNKEVIEQGTVTIHDGRIVNLAGPDYEIIREHGKVIDLEGKTIIPGFVDMHDHIDPNDYDATLAYGVTTARNPSATCEDYSNSEMIETGIIKGPRYFTAGNSVYPVYNVNSLEEARKIVSSRVKMSGIFIKQYLLPTRIQKQWLLMACRENGLNMTNEGQHYWGQLGMVKDGTSGVEHNIFSELLFSKQYNDVASLWAETATYFAPTLIKGYDRGTYSYFRPLYQNRDSIKLKRFWKRFERIENINWIGWDTVNSFENIPQHSLYANIYKKGGNVGMDSHGDDPGIGAHYAIWALQGGGLTNHETLECATIKGAEALGLQGDLGSIEVGKIADLIILDKNPLEDIHNTLSIKYVMKDGVLYDDETLKVVWPTKKR